MVKVNTINNTNDWSALVVVPAVLLALIVGGFGYHYAVTDSATAWYHYAAEAVLMFECAGFFWFTSTFSRSPTGHKVFMYFFLVAGAITIIRMFL